MASTMFRYFYFFLLIFSLSSQVMASDDNKRVIAFAQDTMANDFRKAQVFETRDEVLKHPELSFVHSDGQGHTALMIRHIERFIKQKVDLLIIGTTDEKAIVPVVSKAYKAGIPIILLSRGILSNDYTTFIKYNNRKIGQIAGNFIAKKLQAKGQVLLLEGIPNTDVTRQRTQGFFDAINKFKNIHVIKRTGHFLRKDAVIEMEKLVKQGIHIDAIFSESDSMLSGIRLVLNRYKIDPTSIIMVGVDYISEAQEAIRNGSQLATVTYPLGGKKAVEIALKILKNKPVPKQVYMPFELVTKDNVNDVTPIF